MNPYTQDLHALKQASNYREEATNAIRENLEGITRTDLNNSYVNRLAGNVEGLDMLGKLRLMLSEWFQKTFGDSDFSKTSIGQWLNYGNELRRQTAHDLLRDRGVSQIRPEDLGHVNSWDSDRVSRNFDTLFNNEHSRIRDQLRPVLEQHERTMTAAVKNVRDNVRSRYANNWFNRNRPFEQSLARQPEQVFSDVLTEFSNLHREGGTTPLIDVSNIGAAPAPAGGWLARQVRGEGDASRIQPYMVTSVRPSRRQDDVQNDRLLGPRPLSLNQSTQR